MWFQTKYKSGKYKETMLTRRNYVKWIRSKHRIKLNNLNSDSVDVCLLKP